MSTTPNTDVYVLYTAADQSADPPLEASIQYFTDYDATTKWQPAGPANGKQMKYTFHPAKNTHNFGWYAFSFWPKGSDSNPLTTVVESFRYPHDGQKAYYQSVLYVQDINLDSNTPNFCVCNNNPSSEEMYLGLQVTICARQPGDYYLTSDDPKIPLLPSGTS